MPNNNVLQKGMKENIQNLRSFYASYSKRPGGKLEKRENLTISLSGESFALLNNVIETAMPENPEQSVEDFIREMRALPIHFIWWVTEKDTPSLLQEILTLQKPFKTSCSTGMLLQKDQFCRPGATSLRIIRVENEHHLSDWLDVNMRAWSIAPAGKAPLFTVFSDLLNDSRQRFFLAYENTTPVATSILYLEDSIGGIYWVAADPDFRNKGYASAVTARAAAEAFDSQASLVSLQASDMGRPVYEKLGFKAHGRFAMCIF